MADEAAPALAPIAPAAPIAPSVEGPASGTTPGPVEVTAEAVAPADSPVAVTESTTEAATEAAPSLLSAATAEEVAPAVEAEAPAAEKPAEVAAEVKPEPVEVPLPTYESFNFPEGVQVAAEKVGEFSGMLGEYERRIAADPTMTHAAFQELGQKLVDFYVAQARTEAERMTQAQSDAFTQMTEGWTKAFESDPEIGGNKHNTTLQRAAAIMELYGQRAGPQHLENLKTILNTTGVGNNVEMIRFVNWASRYATETPRIISAAVTPRAPAQAGSRAERLYPTLRRGAA